MKKLSAMLLSAVIMLTALGVTAFAAPTADTANVYVTISDENGKTVLAQEKIKVTDVDGNGTLTVNDALAAAHTAKYPDGAAGFASAGGLGQFIDKLWGVSNGGSYGFYVNNVSAWSLADPISDGDYINAFIYTDLTGYSDAYTYFDKYALNAEQGATVALTLKGISYDSSFSLVVAPLADAVITLNGVATDYRTDANGNVTVKLDNAGKNVISATSSSQVIVPPVCVATVSTNATVKAYVTISDQNGATVMAQEEVTVADVDKDGVLSISDALYAAHEAKFTGGAAAGYAASVTEYGLSLDKLWGVANGGSYGYYLNNVSAWSLADAVKDGDYVNAFVYTDLSSFSDTYCYFDVNTVTAEAGKEITLTLYAAGYDTNYNPVRLAVEGAEITLNGQKTGVKTDGNGKAVITVPAEGSYIISAVSSVQTLVAPVLKATITPATVTDTVLSPEGNTKPKTADSGNVTVAALFAVMSLCSLCLLCKKKNED